MKVVAISSLLNFGRPAPPRRGSAAGQKCLALQPACSACFSLSVFCCINSVEQRGFRRHPKHIQGRRRKTTIQRSTYSVTTGLLEDEGDCVILYSVVKCQHVLLRERIKYCFIEFFRVTELYIYVISVVNL